MPEDYTEYVTHHSFPDAAAYTRRRFGLDMTEEEISKTWLDMALEAYSHQLPLKPGAGEYVRRAHARGERCALLSSCMPELCRAALAHHGLTDCFSHILTAAELGMEKRDPALYRRAAEQCGVPNGDCVLFDDSPLACAAAREAGWNVYGVPDPIFAQHGAEMGKVCHVYPFEFEKEL